MRSLHFETLKEPAEELQATYHLNMSYHTDSETEDDDRAFLFSFSRCHVWLDGRHKWPSHPTPYAELIDLLRKENIKRVTIPDAGHTFSHEIDEFLRLPEQFLF